MKSAANPSAEELSRARSLRLVSPSNRCRHCHGSGREPLPLLLEFSNSGERRGELQRLADRTGLDPSLISRTFAGRRLPSVQTIILLAEALRVSEAAIIHSPPIWDRVRQQWDTEE